MYHVSQFSPRFMDSGMTCQNENRSKHTEESYYRFWLWNLLFDAYFGAWHGKRQRWQKTRRSYHRKVRIMEKDYKGFCEELKNVLKEKFSDDTYHIAFHTIEKNNSVSYDGIAIYSTESSVSPNFSVEPLYENYKNGVSVGKIVDRLAMRYYAEQNQIRGMNLDMDYENCRERIVFRLISYEKNEDMLKVTPHVQFLDMAVVFYVLVYQSEEKVGSFRITKNLMELWNVDQEYLMRVASENTKRLFPLKMHDMNQMVLGILTKKEMDTEFMEYFQKEIATETIDTPVILTTELGINGAAVILYDDTLHVVSDLMQGNFYILPSSIHEVLAIPYTSEVSLKSQELKKIVCEVNEECLVEDEFLSEHVYFYDAEKDMLEICA